MNTIKKLFLVLALLLLLLCAFTGCSKDENVPDNTDPVSAPAESATIIGTWTVDDDGSVVSFVFNEDGTCSMSTDDVTVDMSYVINGSTVITTYDLASMLGMTIDELLAMNLGYTEEDLIVQMAYDFKVTDTVLSLTPNLEHSSDGVFLEEDVYAIDFYKVED